MSAAPVGQADAAGREPPLLIEAVALVEPASLTEADRELVADLMKKGRARLAAVRSRPKPSALADEIRLGPARRTLLPWVVAHEPERPPRSCRRASCSWLGLGKPRGWTGPGRVGRARRAAPGMPVPAADSIARPSGDPRRPLAFGHASPARFPI